MPRLGLPNVLPTSVVSLLAFAFSSQLAPGQTQVVSSPPNYETTEGSSFAWQFGAYPNTRSQIMDGNNRGKPLAITQIDMRLDWEIQSPNLSRGRTWTSVTLLAAASDFDKASSTWTRNYLSTPTTLFSGKVHWPDAPARPANSPYPWGHAQANDKKLQWVFGSPYAHTGKTDTVWDWTFLGGTLDNNVAWGTNTSSSYYLDGLTGRNYRSNTGFLYGTRNANNQLVCVPSSQAANTWSLTYQSVSSYAKEGPVRPDKMTFRTLISGGPKNGNVIAAYSIEGYGIDGNGRVDPTKWPSVGACEGLFLKGVFFLVEAHQLNAYGSCSSCPTHAIPYKTAFVGFRHFGQFAYVDSKTSKFELSNGVWASPVPAHPATVWRSSHMYYHSATTTTGFNHIDSFVPLLLYYTK